MDKVPCRIVLRFVPRDAADRADFLRAVAEAVKPNQELDIRLERSDDDLPRAVLLVDEELETTVTHAVANDLDLRAAEAEAFRKITVDHENSRRLQIAQESDLRNWLLLKAEQGWKVLVSLAPIAKQLFDVFKPS